MAVTHSNELCLQEGRHGVWKIGNLDICDARGNHAGSAFLVFIELDLRSLQSDVDSTATLAVTMQVAAYMTLKAHTAIHIVFGVQG